MCAIRLSSIVRRRCLELTVAWNSPSPQRVVYFIIFSAYTRVIMGGNDDLSEGQSRPQIEGTAMSKEFKKRQIDREAGEAFFCLLLLRSVSHIIRLYSSSLITESEAMEQTSLDNACFCICLATNATCCLGSSPTCTCCCPCLYACTHMHSSQGLESLCLSFSLWQV